MKTKERIFHTVLFEAIGLFLLSVLALFFIDMDVVSLSTLTISLSLIAMIWSYIYNLSFDKIYGLNRYDRTLLMRIGHGFGFEFGLALLTIPVIMFSLNLDLLTVIVLDFGMIIFFFVYTIIFNYSYDKIKFKIKKGE